MERKVVSLWLSTELVKTLDAERERLGHSRSGYVEQILKEWCGEPNRNLIGANRNLIGANSSHQGGFAALWGAVRHSAEGGLGGGVVLTTKTKSTSKVKNKVQLPEWLDVEVWSLWDQYRKAMNKPWTLLAQNMSVKKLSEFRDKGHDPKAIIENSIYRGYTGLFPEHSQNEASEGYSEKILREHAKRD